MKKRNYMRFPVGLALFALLISGCSNNNVDNSVGSEAGKSPNVSVPQYSSDKPNLNSLAISSPANRYIPNKLDDYQTIYIEDLAKKGMNYGQWKKLANSPGVNVVLNNVLLVRAKNVNGQAVIEDVDLGDIRELVNNYAISYLQSQKMTSQTMGVVVPASQCGPRYFLGIPVGYTYCPSQKWSTSTIYYRFDANVPQADRDYFTDQAVPAWIASFNNSTINPSGQYVNWVLKADHPDAVTLKYNPSVVGQAWIGMRRGGGGYLDIGPGNWNVRNLLHEMLHTAGMFHEHQRCDSVYYITLKEPVSAINTNYTRLCGDFGPFMNTGWLGSFDYSSISGYSGVFTANTTSQPSQGDPNYLFLGADHYATRLSEGDVKALLQMYFRDPL